MYTSIDMGFFHDFICYQVRSSRSDARSLRPWGFVVLGAYMDLNALFGAGSMVVTNLWAGNQLDCSVRSLACFGCISLSLFWSFVPGLFPFPLVFFPF